MLKVLFIAGIEGIHISANLGRSEKIGDNYFITNDKPFVDSLLTQSFSNMAGFFEIDYFRKAGAIVYAIDEHEPFENEESERNYLRQNQNAMDLFLQMLWLVKDNAANTRIYYIEFPYKAPAFAVSHLRSFPRGRLSNAIGTFDSVEFTRDELRHSRQLFREHFAGNVVFKDQLITEKHSRFTRAMYFLITARFSHDLGVKIANYSTAFEALFSTDAQELSHKLSERIACFLETDPIARITIFKELKSAYSIRSKVVHGASGSTKVQASAEIAAKSCDNLLRKIFLKILDDRELLKLFLETTNDNDMDNYFLSLIFGS